MQIRLQQKQHIHTAPPPLPLVRFFLDDRPPPQEKSCLRPCPDRMCNTPLMWYFPPPARQIFFGRLSPFRIFLVGAPPPPASQILFGRLSPWKKIGRRQPPRSSDFFWMTDPPPKKNHVYGPALRGCVTHPWWGIWPPPPRSSDFLDWLALFGVGLFSDNTPPPQLIATCHKFESCVIPCFRQTCATNSFPTPNFNVSKSPV
jgi:hypothetical protein